MIYALYHYRGIKRVLRCLTYREDTALEDFAREHKKLDPTRWDGTELWAFTREAEALSWRSPIFIEPRYGRLIKKEVTDEAVYSR